MEDEKVQKLLNGRKNIKLNLIIQGVIIGIVVGLVIVLNRVLITYLTKIFKKLYDFGNDSIIKSILVILIVSLIGYVVGLMTKKEGMISGSGIPQIKGRVINKLKLNWFRILFYKFLGGVLALGAGLSIGREGPSVQIGGSIGEGIAKVCENKVKIKKEYLITAGSSAGLSAAFNSPLSGMVFALEEIHRNFSPLVLLPAMAAALVADFVCKMFLGTEPSLNFVNLKQMPLNYYWILLILGILTGVFGTIFSKSTYIFQDIYAKFKKVPIEMKIVIPFIITAIIGLNYQNLLGGGHELIMELTHGDYSTGGLIILYLAKFLLLLIAFGSGVPGGIFLPMLLLGAIIGNVTGNISIQLFGLDSSYLINFIAFGMAGYFAAVVKAPITGIVLILEMTGSFSQILSLGLVVIVSYITADILKNEPIYEVLLERVLKKNGISTEEDGKKTLIEFVVEMESFVEGKYLNEINWPKGSLIVALKRGDKEIIPRGKIEIISGDYIVVLVNNENKSKIIDKFNKLTLINI